MTLGQRLLKAFQELAAAEVPDPHFDARILFCHTLGCERAALLTQYERVLSESELKELDHVLSRRASRVPVARILGRRGFWGLEFDLNEETLEPRPDSETMIEALLTVGRDHKKILDLGTGSGCLLLALLHEMPEAIGLGIDISVKAVTQAQKNAEKLGLSQRATFKVNHWLQGLTGAFDLVVSNPPYIPTSDLSRLMPEVKDHDPKKALDGGADGLEPYRMIIPHVAGVLRPHGVVAFEVGQGQACVVTELLEKHGFLNLKTHLDLGGIERCVTASKWG